MLDFFVHMVEVFSVLIQFIGNQIQNTLSLLQLLPSAFSYLTVCFGFLPAVVYPFVSIGITICIVFLILGR